MKRLTPEEGESLSLAHFNQWLADYGRLGAGINHQAAVELFTESARYYESPLAKPLVGRDAIARHWLRGARAFKDSQSIFEVISLEGHLGIAHWGFQYTEARSGQPIALGYILLVEFDDRGQCEVLCRWWHMRTVPPGSQPRAHRRRPVPTRVGQ